MHPLLFLDPGHFHAALTLRVPQARAADEVFVYAREGAELRDFLALVERFNRRAPHPPRCRPILPTPEVPLARLLPERRGAVVVLAARSTFLPTSWTRRNGSWAATPRRRRSSRPARGRRECPRRRSGGSPERRGSHGSSSPSSTATR